MMVFSAPRHRTQLSLAFVLFSLTAFAAVGCVDQHVGRLCDLGRDIDAGATTVVSNTGALECPSRICIKPSQERMTTTAALCTAECESNDDCADGERKDTSDTSDHRCQGGFICRYLVNGLQTNELACKRLCVCKDFLRTTDNGPGSDQNCSGNAPNR